MPGIGLITNPRSRLNRQDPGRVRRLGYLIGAHGSAEATQSLDDLHRVCEDFHKERIEILGISGGDGTLHHTLTAMIRAYGPDPLPKVAILRGGTMNTVSASFGIRGDPPRLLFELIDKHRRGQAFDTFTRPLLRVGERFGFIFGNGLVYNFLDAYYATGHPSPATAARLVGQAAASALVGGGLARQLYRRVHSRVTVDGEVWAREDFGLIAASVVEQIGLGFRPFYRLHDRPDAFQILGLHTDVVGFIAELPRIFAGAPMRRDKVIDALAQHVLFESDKELGYTIDGDTYVVKGQLSLGVGPRSPLSGSPAMRAARNSYRRDVPRPDLIKWVSLPFRPWAALGCKEAAPWRCMADALSDQLGILDPERIEEAAAIRAQRRAEEATRAAAEAAREAKRAEHARDLAEVRRHLDEERATREAQRLAMAAERARLEAQQPAVDAARAAAQAQRTERAEAVQARKDARARLEAEASRVAAERAALDAADAAEATVDPADDVASDEDARNQRALAELEAERAEAALAHQALADAMQRELEQIDQRLEARAQARSGQLVPGQLVPGQLVPGQLVPGQLVPGQLAPAQAVPAQSTAGGYGVVVARTTLARKSRLRVSASVLIDHSGTLVALPLVNISLTGALISTGGASLPTLRVGLILLITVFAIEDVKRQVDLVARVVRLGETEAALDWTEDRASAYDLARLLDELSAGKPV